MYQPTDNEIFHVHTKRCKHASEDEDYRYVEAAINLQADRIVFTDHAPFPGNPFRNRMEMEELVGYVESMKVLRREYAGKIEVKFGLEIEYLPSFRAYYRELYDSNEFDLLMLSQHFYENADGSYSFQNADKSEEFKGLSAATVQGIETSLFDVVAHPDRIFRRCKCWNADMALASNEIIRAATEYGMLLERNHTSRQRKNQFWPEFWARVKIKQALEGYDAHSVEEMNKIRLRTSPMLTLEEIESLFADIQAEKNPMSGEVKEKKV